MTTRKMGSVLSDNTMRVYQSRDGRRVFTGTIDLDEGLYQWAPSREEGTVANMSYRGCFSFGVDEWETLVAQGVRRFEFKEAPSGLLYRTTMDIAERHVQFKETPRGPRYLVPHGCFITVRDSDRMVVHERELT